MSRLYVIAPERIGTVSPEIYGHFTEHIGGVFYDGIWVGEDSRVPNIKGFRAELLDKLRAIHPPVIRWPGGCFAETYDWRDGIGDRAKRPKRVNWWRSCDGRYEPNQVGTHEFAEFCRLCGAQPYFAANATSIAPMDIRDWVDYCDSPRGSTEMAELREKNGAPEPFGVKYWGVGNENWGGGGNMTPEEYANIFRRYSVVMDNTAPGLTLVGCGPNAADYDWTRRFMAVLAGSERHMKGYSVHYYCGASGDPLNFSRAEWYQLLLQAAEMDGIINRHWSIIRGWGLEYCSGLFVDEWGAWHPGGSGPSKGYNLFEQQSTMRDAAVAAVTLNIFNNNCDKVKMANVAQMVNNLHALFLAGGDKMCVTPTYHVFDMYQPHKGGEAVKTINDAGRVDFTAPDGKQKSIDRVSVSASVKDGVLTVTAANLDADNEAVLEPEPVGFALRGDADISTLAEADYHAHNTFEEPDRVRVRHNESAAAGRISIPPSGIVSYRVGIEKR